MSQWLLVETFGPATSEPTVIGVGRLPKNFVPLRTVVRSPTSLRMVLAATSRAHRSGEELDVVHGDKRIAARPLPTFARVVHGVQVWSGAVDEELPPRPMAGAWQFNLTTDKISGSDDLLDLYGVPREQRRHERNTAEAFGRLITNVDESAALAKIVQAKPGTVHRATWTVKRDDGQLRAVHFVCRAVAEEADGRPVVVLRGITHDLGPAEATPAAPPPIILAQQVLAGLAEPGTSRAIVNLKTLRIIRWVTGDDPPADIAWTHDSMDSVDHWIHPDDLAVAHRMAESLVRGKAEEILRLRTLDHDWRPVRVEAHLVPLHRPRRMMHRARLGLHDLGEGGGLVHVGDQPPEGFRRIALVPSVLPRHPVEVEQIIRARDLVGRQVELPRARHRSRR